MVAKGSSVTKSERVLGRAFESHLSISRVLHLPHPVGLKSERKEGVKACEPTNVSWKEKKNVEMASRRATRNSYMFMLQYLRISLSTVFINREKKG